MGSFYAEDILRIQSPRVGLLNNGTERTKGTQLQLDTYGLLEKAKQEGHLNFVGNVEAKDAMMGACDVVVCDGFTGNIFLKSIEGTASLIMSQLKSVFLSGPKTKVGALLVKKDLSALKEKLNPDAIGGTPLLGISKPVIKAHGSSSAQAIANAIKQAALAADADISGKLSENAHKMKVTQENS
jgi:glycerol-3-phosphate acyltransferase PlsX